jgi:hypothetical protein
MLCVTQASSLSATKMVELRSLSRFKFLGLRMSDNLSLHCSEFILNLCRIKTNMTTIGTLDRLRLHHTFTVAARDHLTV